MTWTAIVRFLAIISLVLTPAVMLGGTGAMAGPVASAAGHHAHQMKAGHCDDESSGREDKNAGSTQGDCLTKCAIACAAIAPPAADLAAPALHHMAQFAPLVSSLHGLSPESADPPPRIS